MLRKIFWLRNFGLAAQARALINRVRSIGTHGLTRPQIFIPPHGSLEFHASRQFMLPSLLARGGRALPDEVTYCQQLDILKQLLDLSVAILPFCGGGPLLNVCEKRSLLRYNKDEIIIAKNEFKLYDENNSSLKAIKGKKAKNMPNKKMSRRERENLMRRQEILNAALELFSQRGYHNVSMQEVAEKAEFAIGTLYKFFKNKEDLYKALIMDQADRFHEAVTKAIAEPDDEVEKLRNYVRAKGEVFRANVSVVRLYFAETRGAGFNIRVGLEQKIKERYEKFIYSLSFIFEKGMRRKRFQRIADPYHLAVALDSLTNAFLYLWLEDPKAHPYPEDPDVILNILFNGLLHQQ